VSFFKGVTDLFLFEAAAYLLVSLIPSNSFRQMFRSTRSLHIPTRDLPLSPDTTVVLHQVYNVLLGLLSRAKLYVDAAVHGTTKLVPYFSFMTYCLISKTEKLMFSSYFMDLWNLFQPKLSEPAIATNHNKQALLSFWYNVCVDCPENVRLIVQNPVVTKNIAFNYILADHDDQDVVLFNRGMLPAYYGILRLCCEQSPAFTRQLASHQNIQWAFKNLTPHASQYPGVSRLIPKNTISFLVFAVLLNASFNGGDEDSCLIYPVVKVLCFDFLV